MTFELRDIPAPDHVRVVDSHEEYRGPIFTIFNDEIEFANGERVRRQWMKHDDAVGIVALRPSALPGEDWEGAPHSPVSPCPTAAHVGDPGWAARC
ncbi:hypothetical protein QEU96_07960 [Trueperella pyogenes]|uniref:hypothetical protein n=1 Tax=Trueperella pyogenes TaxID=1661 RepID=UPI0032549687